MSSYNEKRTNSELPHSASSQAPPSPAPDFSGAIFLMINSLETGGTERQFVELAQSLRRGGCAVQLGCIQKKGFFLDDGALVGLGDLHQFRLGGSLFGRQSLRSRWRLMRHLQRSEIAIAHAVDF